MRYLSLPGSSGHYVSTPHDASFAITDLDIRVRVALDDWSPASEQAIFGKVNFTGSKIGWYMYWPAGTALDVRWSPDGTFPNSIFHFVTPAGFVDGEAEWLRWTLDVSVFEGKIYGSDDGIVWSQIGATDNGAPTSIFNPSTIPLTVGIQGNLTGAPAAGKFYEAILLDGIDGSEIAHFNACDFALGDSDTATAIDVTGKTWTIHGASSQILDDNSGYCAGEAPTSTAIRSPRYGLTRLARR